MKINHTLKALALAITLALAASNSTGFAQDQKDAPKAKAQEQKSSDGAGERLEPDETNTLPADAPQETQANRREQLSEEEAAILPYYNNFLTTYHLGPEDVISVLVFGQDRYSKAGIIVPPDGTISYPLVGSIFVAGKTTKQVQDELSKRLDEYIIDPQVTVSLEKAVSARYSVLGDVAQPGIRTMTRRLSVYEALAEAGGVLPTGDKKKVVILRRQPDGNVRQIPVNIRDIERGRAKEMAYLVPGDQVVVPGNRLKTIQTILSFTPILSFARIFGIPF